MKKTFFFLATLALALAFASCSSDDGINDDPSNEVAAAKAAIKSKLFEAGSLNETPKAVKVENAMPYTWDKSIDILSNFPESKTPQDGTYKNFIYESKSDEPFTIVMLHSNGAYRHTCGIYWYGEDNNIDTLTFWNEFDEDETNNKWINMNGGKATVISRQDDNCGAYKISLPKGTKFGFYQKSFDKTSKKPVKSGTNEYLFFSESNLNWNNKCQVMTTNKFGDKWTIVGFEDKPYDNSDKDFNDCVFAVNPQLEIVPEPDPTPVHVKGEVETNLSVTEENGTDKVKLSVHVRAVTNVNIFIPITDEALADDFAIVAKHDKEYAYNQELTINGQTVELSYTVTKDGYLKITTSGINEEVIKYCEETYADGLTFECNFFFKDYDESRDAYITFEKEPYVYVTSSAIEATSTDVTLPTDYEVKWKEAQNIEQLDFPKQSGYFIYAQEHYSTYTYEKLKELGWIKFEPAKTETEE